jgi:aryl-alcohol dehydrogenase-like predicted oxidoreductase
MNRFLKHWRLTGRGEAFCAHVTLRWVIDRADTTVALWGARRPDQLAPIGEVMGWKIDRPAILAIDRILAETIQSKNVISADG